MFDLSLWNLIATLGASTIVSLLVLSIFAPHILAVAAEWLKAVSPLIRGGADGIVFLAKGAWEAIKDILDNVYTILFVVALGFATFWYGAVTVKPDCEKCIAELRKEYRFVKKTEAEKKATERPIWKLW